MRSEGKSKMVIDNPLSPFWGGSTIEGRRRDPYYAGYADSVQFLRARSIDPEYMRGYASAENVKSWARSEADKLAGRA